MAIHIIVNCLIDVHTCSFIWNVVFVYCVATDFLTWTSLVYVSSWVSVDTDPHPKALTRIPLTFKNLGYFESSPNCKSSIALFIATRYSKYLERRYFDLTITKGYHDIPKIARTVIDLVKLTMSISRFKPLHVELQFFLHKTSHGL